MSKNKLQKLFSDVKGDFLYEFFPKNKMRHLYLQFHDRSIDPLIYYLLPNISKLIHDIPTLYCCKLIIINPNTLIEFPKLYFNGIITSYIPLFAKNCYIGIDINKKCKKKKFENDKIITVDSSCEYIINNKSDNYALFLSCNLMRTCYNEYGAILVTICDRLASLTSRFKYYKMI